MMVIRRQGALDPRIAKHESLFHTLKKLTILLLKVQWTRAISGTVSRDCYSSFRPAFARFWDIHVGEGRSEGISAL